MPSDALIVTGTVIAASDIEVKKNDFKVSSFLLRIREETEYPQTVIIGQVGKSAGTISDNHVNRVLTCWLDLRGNEYEGKHYTNVNCWKYEVTGESAEEPPKEGEDKLPF